LPAIASDCQRNSNELTTLGQEVTIKQLQSPITIFLVMNNYDAFYNLLKQCDTW